MLGPPNSGQDTTAETQPLGPILSVARTLDQVTAAPQKPDNASFDANLSVKGLCWLMMRNSTMQRLPWPDEFCSDGPAWFLMHSTSHSLQAKAVMSFVDAISEKSLNRTQDTQDPDAAATSL